MASGSWSDGLTGASGSSQARDSVCQKAQPMLQESEQQRRNRAMLAFEPSEFRDRIAKTRQRMERAGVDVLIVANQSNQYYLTGYAGWSDYVPQAVVLSLEGGDPQIIVRDQDVPCAYHTVYMDR